MDLKKTLTITNHEWHSCTRCGRVEPGMRYVGGGQWMCDLCYDDMTLSWEEAFNKEEDDEF